MNIEKNNRISVNNLEGMLNNENYKTFYKQKKKIQSKYDSRLFTWPSNGRKADKQWFLDYGRYEYKKYLKEISTLMFKTNGSFQKFSWDIISDTDKSIMMNKADGCKPYANKHRVK